MGIQPLADKLRPKQLDEIWGQDHLLGKGGFIPSTIQSQRPLSMILWGPPGCGKTSIARLYAKAFSLDFRNLNAIFSGIADLKKIVNEIKQTPCFLKGVSYFSTKSIVLTRLNKMPFFHLSRMERLSLLELQLKTPLFI